MDSQFDRGMFEGQVLARLDAIGNKLDDLVAGTSALEARVRVLENWKYWVMGGAALAGSGASIIINFLVKK